MVCEKCGKRTTRQRCQTFPYAVLQVVEQHLKNRLLCRKEAWKGHLPRQVEGEQLVLPADMPAVHLLSVLDAQSWRSTKQDGARNTTEGGGRKLNENKLLGKGKNSRYNQFPPWSNHISSASDTPDSEFLLQVQVLAVLGVKMQNLQTERPPAGRNVLSGLRIQQRTLRSMW